MLVPPPRAPIAEPINPRGWDEKNPSTNDGCVHWLRPIDVALASIAHEARIDTDRETLCALLGMPLAELQPGACFELEPEDVRALVQSFQLDFAVSDGPVELRGGFEISDAGVSGFLPVQYSNRRTEIHEETET